MLNRLRRIMIKSNYKELVAKDYMQKILDRFNKERPLERRLEEFYNLLNGGQNSRRRSAEVGERRGAGAWPSPLQAILKQRSHSQLVLGIERKSAAILNSTGYLCCP